MRRRAAVVLLLLGLLRVLWAESALGQGFPFPPTPTRRPTLAPTRTPTPAATAPPVPTAVPSAPTPTAVVGQSFITLQLSTYVTGAEITGPRPEKYEVQAGGQWLTLTPRVGCWTTGGLCVALAPTALMRLTFPGGAIREQRLRLTQPRIQLAQAVGPVTLVSFTTPQQP